MNKGTKISLLIGGIIVALIGVIGITFAFFSTGGIQDTANTFQSGCLNISLTSNSSSISLNNILPITDVEGLSGTSYDFTIENTCNTSANYQVNLESLNEQANSLGADYIKVSLSSDTNDNVISILSDNTSVTPEVEGAYEAYNLYTGTLNADETKTYHLRLWLDYDATVEQAANKVYSSKINVIANPETQVVDTLEAKFNIENTTVTSTLTSNVTSASYCVTTNNICTPTTNANISNNSYTIELEESEEEQVVCTRLNGTSKVICSEPLLAKQPSASEVILANKNIDDSRSGAITGTLTADTTGIIYSIADDYGTSYVYAGAPTDNWVSFAGFYWRIIRINGDGSIRMIYNGTDTVTIGTTTQLTNTSIFNSNDNDNAYVGYMYGNAGASSYNATHANNNNSVIKGILDTWYQNNIVANDYDQYISTEQGFCNDRSLNTTSETWIDLDTKLGYGMNSTAYGPYGRLILNGSYRSSQIPSLRCSQTNDYFTINKSSKGNHELTHPIGLITSDEVVLAGAFGGSQNTSYYLYTGQNYWTMSPWLINARSGEAHLFLVHSAGYFSTANASNAMGVRPVINLKADIQFSSGNGTSTNPYVVET